VENICQDFVSIGCENSQEGEVNRWMFFLLSIFLIPTAASHAATQLLVGHYSMRIAARTVPPHACNAYRYRPGWGTNGVFYYPGPSKAGAEIRFWGAKSSNELVVLKLTATPAVGVSKWSGKFSDSASSSVHWGFEGEIDVLDSNSFNILLLIRDGGLPVGCSFWVTLNVIYSGP
jgi:hypothetical protein